MKFHQNFKIFFILFLIGFLSCSNDDIEDLKKPEPEVPEQPEPEVPVPPLPPIDPPIIQDSTGVTSVDISDLIIPSSISFADELVGYISGFFNPQFKTAVIAKTTDGGNTWTTMPVFVDGKAIDMIREIYAKTKNIVSASYVIGDGIHYNCISKDGGITWSKEEKETSNVNGHILYTDNDVKIASDGRYIYKTIDGGNIWEKATIQLFDRSFVATPVIENIIFTSKNIAYTYGGDIPTDQPPPWSLGSMLKTTDGGSTWKQLTHPFGYIFKAVFKDDNNGYTFTFSKNMYNTTDGGATWNIYNRLDAVKGNWYNTSITSGKTQYLSYGDYIYTSLDDFKTLSLRFTTNSSPRGATRLNENTVIFLYNQYILKITD